MALRVAMLGVGAMGRPMATVLHREGVLSAVFDPAPARRRELEALGVSSADSPASAARGADTVLVMVATAAQAEDALFGPAGAASALSPGGTVVVTSTVGVEAIVRLAGRLADAGLRVVDAPVSGGVGRAGTGSLLVMVGAEDAAFAGVAELLEMLGDPVVRVGSTPGDGQRVKLVNQLLCGVHIAAAAEALALADRLGLDVGKVWEVVRTGAAGSFMLDDRGGRMVRGVFEPVNSAVSLFTKDLGLVSAAAAEHGLSVRLAEAAKRIFDGAADSGLADHDDSELFRYLTGGEHGG